MSTHRVPSWLPGILNPHVIALGLLAGTLTFKGLYLTDLTALALYNGSLTYTEGVNAILATRPDLWYHPLDQAPYFPTIYPLLYHAFIYAASSILPIGVFQAMHITAITAGFLTGGVITVLLLDRSYSPHTAILAGLVYALSPTVTGGTVLGRVDHLGVLFGVLALATAVRDRRGDPWTAAAWTIPCMYVKHSLIVFPITITAYYWLNGYRRDAIAYTTATTVVGLGILGVLTVVTEGRAIEHLLVLNSSQAWSGMLSLSLAAWVGFVHIGVATGAIATLIYTKFTRFEAIFFLVALATGLALAGKPGAWTGYYLPAVAAGSILLAYGIERYVTEWDTTRGLLVILALSVQFGLFAAWQPAPEYAPAEQDAVMTELEGVDGAVLSEDNGILVRLGLDREPIEPQVLRSLPASDRPLGSVQTDEIRRREYDAIVLTTPVFPDEPERVRWTREELLAVWEEYELVLVAGEYRVYRPRETE